MPPLLPSRDVMARIDTVISTVADRPFKPDPILGALSGLHSCLGSLIKRDGAIIEASLAEALDRSGYYRTWRGLPLVVSPEADRLAEHHSMPVCLGTELPPSSLPGRTIVLDLVALDLRTGIVTAYEIKRGNGPLDSGKQRQVLRDTLCAGMLVRSRVASLGFHTVRGEGRCIFVYGCRSLPPQIALVGDELDEHFGVSVTPYIEAASSYFRAQIEARLLPRVAPGGPAAAFAAAAEVVAPVPC